MRDIHPSYTEASVGCACGNVVKTRSTRGDFTVDVCGACHPFYTGKQKLMDTAGRVDRFRKKFGGTQTVAARGPAPAQQAASPKAEVKEKKKKAKGEKAPEAPAAEVATEEKPS